MTEKNKITFSATLTRFGLLMILLVFLWTRNHGTFKTTGSSMSPTLESGDVFVVDKFSHGDVSIDRFDIVVFNDLEDGGYMIKRIVGLPNEVIEIKNGVIYINQKPTKKNHRIKPNSLTVEPVRVPANSYFYVGDNRDATVWGIVGREDIVGKAIIE